VRGYYISMKKIFLYSLIFVVSIFVINPFNFLFGKTDYRQAEVVFTARKISAKVNHQPVRLSVSPFMFENTNLLMIPLRSIAELMQYKVDWNQKQNTAYFSKQTNYFSIKIYPRVELIKNSSQVSPYQALLKSGRILLDHKSIGQLMQITQSFDPANSEITYYTKRDQITMKAPDFSLKDTLGKDFNLQKQLQDNNTKLVVLNFYASHCPICSKALPEIEKLHTAYKDKGIVVIGVNTDTQNNEKARDEVTLRYGLTYRILQDKMSQTYDLYSVAGVPNLYIIDPKGVIVQNQSGFEDDYFLFLRDYFDQWIQK
jgi:peroxiredoxin